MANPSPKPTDGRGRWPRPEPVWTGAFLHTLGETGSVTLAAAAAGLTARGAQVRRGRDAAFAAAWAEALDGWRARRGAALLAAAEAAGSEIRREGTALSRPLLQRVPAQRITRAVLERFFAHLSVTANVARSAAAAGVSSAALYRRRQLCPRTSEAWTAALEAGQLRVEAELLRSAMITMDPHGGGVGEEPVAVINVDDALRILGMRNGRRAGRAPRQKPIEEVRASIIRKVEALRRAGLLEPPRES